MIQFFRSFFQSKIGIVVTLAFLALIALAFASMDVANTGTFGSIAGGDRVAAVGDRRITTSDLSVNATNRVDQLRQQNPNITIQAFAEDGGVEEMLDQMISRWALAEFADKLGLRAGDRLVDSEIVQIDAFRGLDGEFDEAAYRAAIGQRGLNEATVRQDLAMGLLARQLITPASLGSRVPPAFAKRYAQLLAETRSGRIAVFPSGLYAPEGEPTDEQLQAFYTENRINYIRPERRVLRYAFFGEDQLGEMADPTADQISRRYQRDIDTYREEERRSLTQLVVPTQAAAQAIVDEVAGGASLEAAAQDKGLATASLEGMDQQTLAGQASAAAAQAAFGTPQGELSAPAQGTLGWYVFRVDSVGVREGKTLEEATAEITEQLRTEQRQAAFNQATSDIDDAFAGGSSLTEIADTYDLELLTTPPLTPTGQVYGTGEPAPRELARVLSLAFELSEGDSQLADTGTGEGYILFDVAQITDSAAAPLAEVREDVVQDWRRDQGMAAAGSAAARALDRVKEGQSLVDAVAAEDVELPTPQDVTLSRQEISQQRQLTPVIMLFFSMAEGTTKRLEQDITGSWFVVQLDDIETPDLADNDPTIALTGNELSTLTADEYAEQLVAAIQGGLDIEINDNAVQAVIAQLTGQDQ